ncbi:GGDEF domain-containing protein [Bradyrhizobium sp. KBS0727]|uniref:GGDEF domain-containing protein n=1 Tax=unclassified Bradyrhizobium TaxID=2631580 RepID=UPI00110F2F9A|nr:MULTISPECIES: sensor domain-containing diguanylate cyclase [unclassified Bradyrhizobium]QDW41006.1 GGDEF domain-containing protein [Bradyrhizobium sp. KBS0725]QDW47612.1 GGDEF domain-containing protein [Bradyrhizobium sp. KBS0727]
MLFGRRKGVAGRGPFRKDPARRPWRLSAKLLIASSVLTVIGFSAICASVMLDMRRGEEQLARQTLENLASGIDADINRNIELYDLSLRAVASNIVMPETKNVSKEIRHLILFDHAATAKHFGAIQVFDAQGKLVVDAASLDPVPENRSDEEYFRAHLDSPDTGLFVSRPMLHRGAYSIVLSRRITGNDGSFQGVVAGSIRFSYFHDLFGRLQLGSNDIITVFRRDGTVIMRTPFDLDVIGHNMSQVPGMHQVLTQPSGSYSRPSVVDGLSRLFVWRDSGFSLIVQVGKPWENILNLWRTEATRIGAIMTALVLVVLGTTLFLAREIGRRAEAEERLEELATTDALTGLRNRRKFDADIDLEWRRAARSGTPVALLMLDADHFKSYNDTWGHQAGDQVLVGIAICISDAVRRAGDCPARFGGEEFAVLLPGLSSIEAFKVAETIRLKVEHWSEDPSVTTVSIGVASMIPVASLDWSDLIEAADKALYAAKANGRNQSVLASLPQLALVA